VRPPAETLQIYSTGKRWMWRFQHINGRAEINELHVPKGRPVKITFTSEDVLHDIYIPAFRVKADAIPGATARSGSNRRRSAISTCSALNTAAPSTPV
jgi:cytochrome c oxidase subunit 2